MSINWLQEGIFGFFAGIYTIKTGKAARGRLIQVPKVRKEVIQYLYPLRGTEGTVQDEFN